MIRMQLKKYFYKLNGLVMFRGEYTALGCLPCVPGAEAHCPHELTHYVLAAAKSIASSFSL